MDAIERGQHHMLTIGGSVTTVTAAINGYSKQTTAVWSDRCVRSRRL